MVKHHISLLLIFFLMVVSFNTVGCKSQVNHATNAQRGFEAMEQGDHDAAYKYFEKAVEIRPSDWKSQHYLGRLQVERGMIDKAQISFEQALSMRGDYPETGDIIDDLADVYYRQGDGEKLIVLLDESCERYGQSRDFIRLGKYLQLAGDADGALLAYKKAVQFAADDNATPYIALADFYESLGDKDNTILMLRQAYYITPNDKALADRFRQYGIVPGPTVALEPIRQ